MNKFVGTIYDNTNRVVVVNMGARGPKGLTGEQGDKGDAGDTINLVGQWVSGRTYAPLDAVTWRSSAVSGASSLYVQNSGIPASPSTIEPHLDQGRWSEIGAQDVNGSFGGIWQVDQVGHPFTKIGQPAALTASGYELATANTINTLGVAMVREVISSTSFILQSTGGLPDVDPTVSSRGFFLGGGLYYVSSVAGLLTDLPPAGAGQYVNPIYKAEDATNGVVLPWTPVEVEVQKLAVPVEREKFFYTASDGQTVFTGPDEEGNTPDFTNAGVEVFQNGLNLRDNTQFTHTDENVTLASPAAGGDRLEIWSTKEQASQTQTWIKADPIIFDGTTIDYPVNDGGVTAPLGPAASFEVYLDGNRQEPDVDYAIVDVAGQTTVRFTVAPEPETTSWITYGTG